jgi:hypothetical protein
VQPVWQSRLEKLLAQLVGPLLAAQWAPSQVGRQPESFQQSQLRLIFLSMSSFPRSVSLNFINNWIISLSLFDFRLLFGTVSHRVEQKATFSNLISSQAKPFYG